MTQHFEEMVKSNEPVMRHVSEMCDHWPAVGSVTEAENLRQKLSQVHDSLTKIKKVVEEKETDKCLLEGHAEKLPCIYAEQQGIEWDLLEIDDYESLAGKATGLEEASYEQQ